MLTLPSIVDAEEYGDDTIQHDDVTITTLAPVMVTLRDISDFDLSDEWVEWRNEAPFYERQPRHFQTWLARKLIEPSETDDLLFCAGCEMPFGEYDVQHEYAGDIICEACAEKYSSCDDCGALSEYTTTTLDDQEVCESCRDYNYYYCDHCDGYYHPDSEYHDHDEDCSCEAPAQNFRIRNDGDDPLQNDHEITVSLPAGVISDEGIGAMARVLQQHGQSLVTDPVWPDWAYDSWNQTNWTDEQRAEYDRLVAIRRENQEIRQKWYQVSYTLADIGQEWQTKQGNFTKRLSRHAYKTYGLKLPNEVLSEIGNLGSQHSQGSEVRIAVTRNLNLPASEFAHDESCWWQSYHASRCALKNNGGFGLRSFGTRKNYWGATHEGVNGRAWVMPMRLTEDERLVPTFETENPDALVVFNGYGDLSGYTPVRIMAHLYGMTYRKVSFSCDPMYVNGDQGYLVTSEEIAQNYTDGRIHLSVDEHANLHSRDVAEGRLTALVNA